MLSHVCMWLATHPLYIYGYTGHVVVPGNICILCYLLMQSSHWAVVHLAQCQLYIACYFPSFIGIYSPPLAQCKLFMLCYLHMQVSHCIPHPLSSVHPVHAVLQFHAVQSLNCTTTSLVQVLQGMLLAYAVQPVGCITFLGSAQTAHAVLHVSL